MSYGYGYGYERTQHFSQKFGSYIFFRPSKMFPTYKVAPNQNPAFGEINYTLEKHTRWGTLFTKACDMKSH